MAFPWVEVGTIAAVLAAAGTILGTDWLPRLGRYLHRTRPFIRPTIVRWSPDSWQVRVMVSVPPTKPPLLLYTLLGYVTSTDREAPFLGVPVLLERGPGPRLLVSEEFTYLVEHVPLPPRDKHYILTLNLVAEGLRLTRRYEITHTGGWREERGWLGRRIESYKARRFFKTAKRV